MKNKYLRLLFTAIFCGAVFSCIENVPTEEAYIGEIIYSHKVSNANVSLGYQRVVLNWDNPANSQVAKSILVEYSTYGSEKFSQAYPSMVDKAEIDHLDSGFGYDFSIYTLDSEGNRSLPLKISGVPFSGAALESIVENTGSGYVRFADEGYALRYDFSAECKYVGELEWTLTGPDGFEAEGTQEGATETKVSDASGTGEKVVALTTPVISGFTEGNEYTVTTKYRVVPYDGERYCLDTVTLEKTATFTVIIPRYRVSFNVGMGSPTTIPAQIIEAGGKVTDPGITPTHPDKIFTGWRVLSEPALFGRYYDFSPAVNSDLTIHAVWVPKTIAAAMAPEMIQVEGGTFSMGDTWSAEPSAIELPVHQVTVSDFYMSKYEVTQELFAYVLNGYNPILHVQTPLTIHTGPTNPASNITFNEAVVFCNYMSILSGLEPCYTLTNTSIPDGSTNPVEWWYITTSASSWQITCDLTKKGYRLPTEAEWEYAAGGGELVNRKQYSGTSVYADLPLYAWCATIAEDTPHPVGTKLPNNLGIYDLSGNVMEWCTDLYSYNGNTVTNYYTAGAQTNPCVQPTIVDSPTNAKRICRGGGYKWANNSHCRTSWRDGNAPGYRSGDLGIRLVRTK